MNICQFRTNIFQTIMKIEHPGSNQNINSHGHIQSSTDIGSVLVFHLPASIHAWRKANCSPKKWKSAITNFSPPFPGHLKPSWWFQDSFIFILTSGNDSNWLAVDFFKGVGLKPPTDETSWSTFQGSRVRKNLRSPKGFPPWSQGLLWWHHWEHFRRLLGQIRWTLPGVLDSNHSFFVVKVFLVVAKNNWKKVGWYCWFWWKKSCTTWHVWNPLKPCK